MMAASRARGAMAPQQVEPEVLAICTFVTEFKRRLFRHPVKPGSEPNVAARDRPSFPERRLGPIDVNCGQIVPANYTTLLEFVTYWHSLYL